MEEYDVIVVGGGQSGLACAYYLRRSGLAFVILDDQPTAGGAWLHGWDSLTLFSPSDQSSLPGRMMRGSKGKFPSRDEVIDYLADYESHYAIPVHRPVTVHVVQTTDTGFEVQTSKGTYRCKAIISATGTWYNPYIPDVPGRESFGGSQLHSSTYKNSDAFNGRTVLVVGGGNSGAQILAEVSKVATTIWSVLSPPEYLPDDVDGRVLFDLASARYHALQSGKEFNASQYSLGNIVMVPSVVDARERNVLHYRPPIARITPSGIVWPDGHQENIDTIIWCTGFTYATDYLRSLDTPGSTVVGQRNIVDTIGTRSTAIPGLYLVGYGSWTGFASATLIGVGRSAKATVLEIQEYIVGGSRRA